MRAGKPRWIGAAQDAKCEDENNEDAELPEILGNGYTATWKAVTLTKLFRGQNKCPLQLLPMEIDAESDLIEALANIDEDVMMGQWRSLQRMNMLCKV